MRGAQPRRRPLFHAYCHSPPAAISASSPDERSEIRDITSGGCKEFGAQCRASSVSPECFVNSVLLGELQQLVNAHGYWVVALIVGLESMGIPLPGETILVLAAIYAAADPTLNIWLVIAAAAVGSIIGDNLGYWIGKRYAYAILVRYGRHIGMSAARIKVGQYLFRKHGAKVVFFGRFVALLRILAAFLAGVNRMPWRAFLVANAAGAVLWASAFGIGGYF